ncbi:MAG: hypothetical protein IPL01_11470 [Acidobacteria bacterium]|nr:hypothetical protein [Acidobacteriota bacterium]
MSGSHVLDAPSAPREGRSDPRELPASGTPTARGARRGGPPSSTGPRRCGAKVRERDDG